MVRLIYSAVVCAGLFCWGIRVSFAQNTTATDQLPSVALREYLDRILVEHNPFAATAYIDSVRKKGDWPIEDANLRHRVYAEALELKDLDDLVHAFSDAEPIRRGLEARKQCQFCQKPNEFLAWTDRYFDYFSVAHHLVLRQAVLEWDTLDPERQKWLVVNGESSESWSRLDLPQRLEKMKAWVTQEIEKLISGTPKDEEELASFCKRGDYLKDLLSPDQFCLLRDRARAARALLGGLSQAQAHLASGTNLVLKITLEQAKNTPDMGDKLALLSKVFDGLGIKNEAVSAEAPARDAQRFTETDRRIFSAMLATNLLHETEGTWAGKELRAFYSTNRLDLRLAPISDANTIASADKNDILSFSEAYIQQHIKGKGHDIADLWNGKAPELYKELMTMLSGIFVHETTHQRQHVWAKTHSLPSIGGQHIESEAVQVETLFVLEKSMHDPAYAEQLKKNASWSMLARKSMNLAQSMRTNTLPYFRDTINAWIYPGDLSLEGAIKRYSSNRDEDIGEIQAELARRHGLSHKEQRTLERASPMPRGTMDDTAWHRAIKESGTKSLESLMTNIIHRLDAVPNIYSAYSERLKQANELIEKQLNELLSNTNTAFEKGIDKAPTATLPQIK